MKIIMIFSVIFMFLTTGCPRQIVKNTKEWKNIFLYHSAEKIYKKAVEKARIKNSVLSEKEVEIIIRRYLKNRQIKIEKRQDYAEYYYWQKINNALYFIRLSLIWRPIFDKRIGLIISYEFREEGISDGVWKSLVWKIKNRNIYKEEKQ